MPASVGVVHDLLFQLDPAEPTSIRSTEPARPDA